MRVHHVLHRVGDQLAAGQRVEHAAVPHRDAVVHRDGVELLGDRAGLLDRLRHDLAHVAQVHVAGHELGERVGDGHDRLAEVVVGHPGRSPERPGSGHVATRGRGGRPKLFHRESLLSCVCWSRGGLGGGGGGDRMSSVDAREKGRGHPLARLRPVLEDGRFWRRPDGNSRADIDRRAPGGCPSAVVNLTLSSQIRVPRSRSAGCRARSALSGVAGCHPLIVFTRF